MDQLAQLLQLLFVFLLELSHLLLHLLHLRRKLGANICLNLLRVFLHLLRQRLDEVLDYLEV